MHALLTEKKKMPWIITKGSTLKMPLTVSTQVLSFQSAHVDREIGKPM